MRFGFILGTVLLALAAGCDDDDNSAKAPVWTPDQVLDSPGKSHRGFVDVRGIIHAHSVFSHDACDGAPVLDDGQRDAACMQQFREGVCGSKQDFIMLTDHPGTVDSEGGTQAPGFAGSPYPDVLLYQAELGDQLVERNGQPVANLMKCSDGRQALILGGCESSNTMAIGLEGHIANTAKYGDPSQDTLEQVGDVYGLRMLVHTEKYSPGDLATLPIEGFEMFNLHANTLRFGGIVLTMLANYDEPDRLGHLELMLAPLMEEDPRYLERWAGALARGAKLTTTMGTDAHQNTIPGLMPDGERGDSYRRMMRAFSNHVLVRPQTDGTWTDRDLKDAVRAGRLYGAFEVFGYPTGFDFVAEGASVHEMGAEIQTSEGATLRITAPSVQHLDPKAKAPVITVEIARATEQGWDVVASGSAAASYSPTEAGAYRATAYIEPHHLTGMLGDNESDILAKRWAWVYGNAIYIR